MTSGVEQKDLFLGAIHTRVAHGHIARLTPIHNALHFQVSLASGHSLGGDWRRRPGRPRAHWTDQLRDDTGSVPANLWRQTGLSTGPWWSDTTARAGYAMTTTMYTDVGHWHLNWPRARPARFLGHSL